MVAGQNLTPVDSAANLANLISVKTTTPITAGTDAETTEITRNRAQYYLAYDDQVVWGGDYTYFLVRNIRDCLGKGMGRRPAREIRWCL